MGVGIPGTDMIGLPIAIALGVLIGKSAYQLEVLKDSNEEAVEQGKKLIDAQAIDIKLKQNIEEKLYIEVHCRKGNDESTAIISGGHTHFVYVEKNGEVLLDERVTTTAETEEQELTLNLKKVYEFATTTPIDEIRFILEAKRLNMNAAELSFKGNFGHHLGKTLKDSKSKRDIMGNNTLTHILSYTSAACDARMAGAMIPVMSNSGSGNQGIAAHTASSSLCRESSEERRRTDSCPDVEPPYSYLYQTKFGKTVGFMWMCSSSYGKQLWYHFTDGRYLPASIVCRSEYDRQPDRYDL